jgi:hypothetical protein
LTINVTQSAVPVNLRRLDGTPLTPTCEVPLKMCCGAVLLGEECGCGTGEFGEYFNQTIVWGQSAVSG